MSIPNFRSGRSKILVAWDRCCLRGPSNPVAAVVLQRLHGGEAAAFPSYRDYYYVQQGTIQVPLVVHMTFLAAWVEMDLATKIHPETLLGLLRCILVQDCDRELIQLSSLGLRLPPWFLPQIVYSLILLLAVKIINNDVRYGKNSRLRSPCLFCEENLRLHHHRRPHHLAVF